ncbi:S49 family peptidase [Aeoliella mucimassa]|uniref:Signal peptide peptidase SppA n=1 Tax=Aeoliella mucimassa TaxID=2527972 RepID=A0A518AN74_9BACT|nr:S49 family peptidase [Aeoliella mucimassa]QDU56156.1 Putative signal peptide peptidase SppA [Aeoliella mucimassa]
MSPDTILVVTPDIAMALAEGKKLQPAKSTKSNLAGCVPLVGEINRLGAEVVGVAIQHLAYNDDIGEIYLYCDSPGGSAIASSQLAERVAAAAKIKPVHVFADGMLASGAVYVASQATTITATRQTFVGSIGTIMVLADSEKLYERLGVRVIPISTGRFKEVGLPGKKVTAEDIDAIRQLVSTTNEMFLADLARGRNLSVSYVRNELATGAVWSAQQAKERGLIDFIRTWDDFTTELQQRMHTDEVELPSNVAGEPYGELMGKAAADRFKQLCGVTHWHEIQRSPAKMQAYRQHPQLAKHAESFHRIYRASYGEELAAKL